MNPISWIEPSDLAREPSSSAGARLLPRLRFDNGYLLLVAERSSWMAIFDLTVTPPRRLPVPSLAIKPCEFLGEASLLYHASSINRLFIEPLRADPSVTAMEWPGNSPALIQVSPSNRWVAVRYGGNVLRVWDARRNEVVMELRYSRAEGAPFWARDDRHLIFADEYNCTVRIFRMPEEK